MTCAAAMLLAVSAASPAGQWVFLGSAATGQALTLDASSISADGPFRTAWFRIFNAGDVGREVPAYLLRLDCGAKTINSMGLRKFNGSGAIAEERVHGPAGEGAMPVEDKTVTEIAYTALCTRQLELVRSMGEGRGRRN